MNLQPEIRNLSARKLVGQRQCMSLAADLTRKLWQTFMPRRKEIKSPLSTDLISMQVFPSSFDFRFQDAGARFEKWAAVEVEDFEAVPNGMETFCLAGGLYAVFHYRGLSSNPEIYRYIFGIWLPESTFEIDDRPHFEILGAKYKNNDPASEEEIFIPVKWKK